jgi:Ca2+-binding EF-hand superfamily protein
VANTQNTDITNLVFSIYDTNQDQFLTLGEVTQILSDSVGGSFATQENATWMIKAMDINNDGKLDWDEIYAALK